MNKRLQLIRKGMSNYEQNPPKPKEPEIKPQREEPEIENPSTHESPGKSQPKPPDISPGKTKEPDIPKPAPSEPYE